MRATSIAFTLLFLTTTQPAAAQAPVKVGPELQLNTYATGFQFAPEVTAMPDGGYLATWQSQGIDGDQWGIGARWLGADGLPIGDEFQINSATTGVQLRPVVAADAGGGFVVAWESDSDESGNFDIHSQRFSSDGTAIGMELKVNTLTEGNQAEPAVATRSSGGFLVVWHGPDGSGNGIFGRAFDAAGQAIGGELQVNDATTYTQAFPRVEMTEEGFVVIWEGEQQDGDNDGIFARYLGPDGSPMSGEILVNTFTLDAQEKADLTVANDGTLAVVWQSATQDGSGTGIFGQVFDSSGVPVGTEMQINSTTESLQRTPGVALDGSGRFVAIWESRDQLAPGSENIFGRRFNASGELVGGEFRVDTRTDGYQNEPQVAGGPGGDFMVVWALSINSDLLGQRFEITLFADGFESGDTSAWSGVDP